MIRLTYLVVALALACQSFVAAAGTFCSHEGGTAAVHFGHHAHVHLGSESGEPDTDSPSAYHADCNLCHLGIAMIQATTSVDGYSSYSAVILVSANFVSLSPPGPERPNWSVAT